MNHPQYTPTVPNWSLIPDYMVGSLRRYIENGIEPGHFLTAILCNDLKKTFTAADSVNARRVRDYVDFLYNYAPSDCWGSPQKYDKWIEQGGLGLTEIAGE